MAMFFILLGLSVLIIYLSCVFLNLKETKGPKE